MENFLKLMDSGFFMFKIIILFIFSKICLAGFPPTTLRGQSQSTATTTFNFQVPNNQATKTATGTLVETGSQNLLSNPGFEHSTVGTDWNVTNGTLTASSSAPFGSFYGTFSGSIANGNIQSLTGSGTAQAGLNCLVSAYVKTASSNVQLCAIHNGTLNTNLCVSVNSNNAWAQYQIPTVCDATSTVARVRITTSVATTFDVDNVYVGINPNFGSLSQSQYVGSLKFIGAAGCAWSTSAATFTTLATVSSCNSPLVTGNILSNGGAKAPQFIMSGQAGTYRIVVHGGTVNYSGLASGAVASRWTDGTNVSSISQGFGSSTGFPVAEYTMEYSSSFSNATFSMQARGNGSTGFYFTSDSAGFSDAIISVYYFPPSSSIVTTTNQDYDWTAYTPTITGFGTPTNVAFYHKRQGSDLLIRGQFVSGTSTAVEARVSLPVGLTSSSSMATLEYAGHLVYNTPNAATYELLIEPSVSYLTFGFQNAAAAGFVKRVANTVFSAGQGGSFFARIPIQGWNNNNVIVGTFENSFSTWSSPTTITLGGTTTAPTKGTTTTDQVRCRKAGKNQFECEFQYKHGAAGSGGSGDYLFSLPSGYTFDTSINPPETTFASINNNTMMARIDGSGAVNALPSSYSFGLAGVVYSSSQFRIFNQSSSAFIGSTSYSFSNANFALSMTIRFSGTGPNN